MQFKSYKFILIYVFYLIILKFSDFYILYLNYFIFLIVSDKEYFVRTWDMYDIILFYLKINIFRNQSCLVLDIKTCNNYIFLYTQISFHCKG